MLLAAQASSRLTQAALQPRGMHGAATTQPLPRSRRHSFVAAAASARRRLPPACASAGGEGGAAPSSSSSGGSSGGAAELEGLLYGPDVPLSALQARLEAAVEAEDYDLAAQLRDVLQRRRFDVRLAVEEANERFYKAFQSGNMAAMSEVWGKGEHVQCIHPLANCIAGRPAVMESWRMILGGGRLRITLEDVRIAAADSRAFVTCVELTESGEGRGRIVATNIFEVQEGRWKLVHHHGSPAAKVGMM